MDNGHINGHIIIPLMCMLLSCPLFGAIDTVSTVNQLHSVLNSAQPGDIIVMKDGTWNNAQITLSKSGTATDPIIIKAENPGDVVLTGSSTLNFTASYIVADGIVFENGALSSGQIIRFSSDHCRLTQSAIIDYNPSDPVTTYYWVYFDGSYNRMDHCYITGKNHQQPTVGNDGSDSRHNKVDSCYFKDLPSTNASNGREVFRIWGYGGNEELGDDGAFFTIEYNLFDHADGEGLECISLKSNRNTVRYNTIKDTKGEITIRSGNYDTIVGNFILGGNVEGSRGIRICGQSHIVANNYLENCKDAGIILYCGEYIDTWLTPDYDPVLRDGTPLGRVPRYGWVKNGLFAHNTLVNVGGSGFEVGGAYKSGWPTSQRVLIPENNTIINNCIVKNGGTAMRMPTQDTNAPLDVFTFVPNIFEGNIVYGGSVNISPVPAGISTENPDLVTGSDDRYRPSTGSCLIDNGVANPQIIDDMDGQRRDASPDIGADEVSNTVITRRPLMPADVGPYWMQPTPVADVPNTHTNQIKNAITIKQTFHGYAIQIHTLGYMTNNNKPLTIAIYDLNGKLIAENEAICKGPGRYLSSFDNSLSTGKMYLVQVQNGTTRNTQKMVKYR